MKTKFHAVLLLLGGLSFALSVFDAYGQTKVVIGYSSLSSNQAAIWVAKEAGFFKKAGLDAQLVLIEGGTRGAQALISGDLPMLAMGGQSVISARARGADLVLIAGLVNRMNYILAGAPAIKGPEDLKTKRIAVSQFGTSSYHAVILALKHWKMDAKRDGITLLQVGNQGARVASLQSGGSDAAIVNPGLGPALKARGLNILADFTELPVPYPQMVLGTRESFLKNEPDLAERILKAMVGANAFILEPKNNEEIKSVLAKYLRLGGPAEAEEHYQSALKVFSKKPFVDSKGISSMIEFMGETDPAVARLKPEAVINHALLKKLDEAGFLNAPQSRP